MRFSPFSLVPLLLSLVQAQTPSSENGIYEERPGLGVFYEFSGPVDVTGSEYTVFQQPYSISVEDNGPLFGLAGHMPLNKFIGLQAQAAYQQMKFKYAIQASEDVQKVMLGELESTVVGSDTLEALNGLTEDDLKGELISRNLIVQLGAEAGYPFFTSYKYQMMGRLLVFGSGSLGKTFFDDSKFDNAVLWGYAYGAGARFAWGPVILEGGIRMAHVYWRTYFDPSEMTGDQAMDDTFMMDFDTPLRPYIRLCWSLY